MSENRSGRKNERASSQGQSSRRASERSASSGNSNTRRSNSAPSRGQGQNRQQGQRQTANRASVQRTQQPSRQQQAQRRIAAPQQRQGSRPVQRSQAPRRAPQRQPEVSQIDFAAVVRGIIAVALTCMIVCMIVIMFAKTLFVSDAELQKTAKTGHLTETQFEQIEAVQPYTREEVVTTEATKKKKKTTTTTTTAEEVSSLPDGVTEANAGDYTVNSAVYLHPSPDANSANLATLPYGTKVKVLGSTYGWYYLEYEGQKGYAWGTYFTKAG